MHDNITRRNRYFGSNFTLFLVILCYLKQFNFFCSDSNNERSLKFMVKSAVEKVDLISVTTSSA